MLNPNISAENWFDPAELVVSLWLLASPFVLGFFDIQSASIVMIGIGTLVFLTSQLGLSNHLPWEEWANVILAVLLLSSPWLFGFSGSMPATINALASGLILGILAVAALKVDYNYLAAIEHSEKLHTSRSTSRGSTHQ